MTPYFRKFSGQGGGPRKPSIQNILWILRQYQHLDPFSKDLVRNYILAGELPSDWSEIIENCYKRHFDERPKT